MTRFKKIQVFRAKILRGGYSTRALKKIPVTREEKMPVYR